MTSDGLRGNLLLLDIQIDEWLHRLHLLLSHELVVLGDCDKVDEAHVQHFVAVDVPERIQPVAMVQVGVAAEHLLHDTLAILVEGRRETARLPNPILAGKGSQGRIQVSGTGRDWCACWWSRHIARSKGVRRTQDRFCGEHDRVVDLADNPFLNPIDKFGC